MTALSEYRKKSGLSQSQLAEKSGINFRMIQYYEQGARDISKASAMTVYSLAKALGCTMEDLLK